MYSPGSVSCLKLVNSAQSSSKNFQRAIMWLSQIIGVLSLWSALKILGCPGLAEVIIDYCEIGDSSGNVLLCAFS